MSQSEGLPIGVALGTIGATATWWLQSAIRLDAAGYRALWAWDHFVGQGNPRVPVVEQWTMLAAASGTTARIGLGSYVANVMNRHPAVLARMASTLQEASHGRVTLGIGVGGGAREHRAYGIPFPPVDERAARLEEAVAVIRALWAGGPVTRDSPFYPLADAHAEPAPDPTPKILIGASSSRGVRIAARLADGWAAEEADYLALRQRFLDALDAAGRSRKDVRILLGFGSGRSGEDMLHGSPWIESPRDEWARWRESGADEIVVTARTPSDVDALIGAVERW